MEKYESECRDVSKLLLFSGLVWTISFPMHRKNCNVSFVLSSSSRNLLIDSVPGGVKLLVLKKYEIRCGDASLLPALFGFFLSIQIPNQQKNT